MTKVKHVAATSLWPLYLVFFAGLPLSYGFVATFVSELTNCVCFVIPGYRGVNIQYSPPIKYSGQTPFSKYERNCDGAVF